MRVDTAEKKMNRVAFVLLSYFFIVLWGAFASLKILWEIIMRPKLTLKRTRREVPPACMLDPALGSHEYVTANGLKFHYVVAGNRTKPLMLLLHGFPEFWFSWRYQLRAFSKDYRVVAVDLRGYNDTQRPQGRKEYVLKNLRQDIVELIPALGHTSCVLVGHDWGGAIAWSVAHHNPELVDKLIVLNCPHTRIMWRHLSSTWKQMMRSWYMFMFQIPKLPEFMMSLRDYGYFSAIFRGRQGGVRNKDAFTTEAVEAYKYVFSQPGALTGPVNYIRCIFEVEKTEKKLSQGEIETPTLLIWGDSDAFLDSAMADKHTRYVTDLTVKHIPNCSHWVQQDQPDLVNEYIKEFLES